MASALAPVLDPVADLTQQITDLTTKAAAKLDALGTAPTQEEFAAGKQELADLKAQILPLQERHEQAQRDFEIKALRQELEDLKSARTPRKFEFNVVHAPAKLNEPFPLLVLRAKRGDGDARVKLVAIERKAMEDGLIETKALGEGGNAAGGFLVPPEYIQELVLLRRATAPLLDYVRRIPVSSNLVYVPQQTGVSTVGWTAENAPKPSTDEVLGQLSVNVFTLAGIAKVSNQLLQDSTPAVDSIVRQDLMRGLNIEMDRVIINGSGTGQPTGILNTAGVVSTASTATAGVPQNLLDDIIKAIGRMQQAYFGQPDGIVMSPRTWAALETSKDTTGRYLAIGTATPTQQLSLPGVPVPTSVTADGMGITGGPVFTLFGIPIIVDANMPINLTGANSAVIVGAFREFWALMRDDIRMDVSDQAGTSFETNSTWFRGECRMGFTAARLASAAQIISAVAI